MYSPSVEVSRPYPCMHRDITSPMAPDDANANKSDTRTALDCQTPHANDYFFLPASVVPVRISLSECGADYCCYSVALLLFLDGNVVCQFVLQTHGPEILFCFFWSQVGGWEWAMTTAFRFKLSWHACRTRAQRKVWSTVNSSCDEFFQYSLWDCEMDSPTWK